MRMIGYVALAFVLASTLGSGCKSKAPEATDPTEMTKLLNEGADIFASIKDKASADAAKPKLMALAERRKKYTAADDARKAAKGTQPVHSEAQKQKLDEAKRRYQEEWGRVWNSDVPGVKEMLDEFTKASTPDEPAPKK